MPAACKRPAVAQADNRKANCSVYLFKIPNVGRAHEVHDRLYSLLKPECHSAYWEDAKGWPGYAIKGRMHLNFKCRPDSAWLRGFGKKLGEGTTFTPHDYDNPEHVSRHHDLENPRGVDYRDPVHLREGDKSEWYRVKCTKFEAESLKKRGYKVELDTAIAKRPKPAAKPKAAPSMLCRAPPDDQQSSERGGDGSASEDGGTDAS